MSAKYDYKRLNKVAEWVRERVVVGRGEKMEIVGGMRRGLILNGDLDLLTNVPIADVMKRLGLKDTGKKGGNVVHGDAVLRFMRKGVPVDINYSSNREWPYALLHHTGSKDFNIRMRRFAKIRGWKLNQHGLWVIKTLQRLRGSVVGREREIFVLMGFPWREVWERDDMDVDRIIRGKRVRSDHVEKSIE